MAATSGHFVILGVELVTAFLLTFVVWETAMALKKKVVTGQMTVDRAQLLLGFPGVLISLLLPIIVILANRFEWFGFHLDAMPALLAMLAALFFGMILQVIAYLVFGLMVELAQKKAQAALPTSPPPPA